MAEKTPAQLKKLYDAREVRVADHIGRLWDLRPHKLPNRGESQHFCDYAMLNRADPNLEIVRFIEIKTINRRYHDVQFVMLDQEKWSNLLDLQRTTSLPVDVIHWWACGKVTRMFVLPTQPILVVTAGLPKPTPGSVTDLQPKLWFKKMVAVDVGVPMSRGADE